MISLEPLDNFNSKFTVASCFVECGDEILILKRHQDKPQGGNWGLPTGKVDDGETELQAMVRELFEETGLQIPEQHFKAGKKMYVKYPTYDFIFQTYSLPFLEKPEIKINSLEHSEYQWKPKEQLAEVPLIQYFLESMELHYQ